MFLCVFLFANCDSNKAIILEILVRIFQKKRGFFLYYIIYCFNSRKTHSITVYNITLHYRGMEEEKQYKFIIPNNVIHYDRLSIHSNIVTFNIEIHFYAHIPSHILEKKKTKQTLCHHSSVYN